MKMLNKRKRTYEIQADYGNGYVCLPKETCLSAAKYMLKKRVSADGMRTKYRIKKY